MILSERSHLFVAALSHPGMSGKNNEDNYAVSAHYFDAEKTTPSLLAIVADGIGGHRAGEVASEIATETISKIVSESENAFPPDVLEEAIMTASRAIFDQTNTDETQMGMGSTCVCAWIIGDQLYTAYVGDSRIYLRRDQQIKQLSIDHSWVQEAIEHGIITPEQAKNHPRAHVIRRYLGANKPVEVDFRLQLSASETTQESVENQGTHIYPGDQILLCSDGLTDLVSDDEIAQALGCDDLEKAVQDLVNLANARGGHDNITIIALEVPGQTKAQPSADLPKPEKAKTSRQLIWAISILIFVSVVLGAILYLYMSQVQPRLHNTTTVTLTEPVLLPTTPAPQPSLTATALPNSPTPGSPTQTYTPWPTHTTEP